MGRAADAIATYEEALQLQPDNPTTWYNKVCHHGENGEVAEAISSLQHALQLHPDFADNLKTDKSFNLIRDNPEFQKLINKYSNPK